MSLLSNPAARQTALDRDIEAKRTELRDFITRHTKSDGTYDFDAAAMTELQRRNDELKALIDRREQLAGIAAVAGLAGDVDLGTPILRSGAPNDVAYGLTPDGERIPLLTKGQPLADVVRMPAGVDRSRLSFGQFVKGAITGDWSGASAELKTMSIGTATAGGHLVPAPLAADVIDKARNVARVMQAGAITVPMTSSTLKVARVTTDATAGWKAENAAFSASDLVLDAVTFTAHTLTALVKFSRELWEDAINMPEVIDQSVAAAIALELDRVALYGSGVAPEPEGLLNMTGFESVSMGANGAALTDYDDVIDAILNVLDSNHVPNAAIYAPRTEAALAKLKDTQNNPLQVPRLVDDLTKLVTNQVPIDRTQGTANNATDYWVGQWNQLMIGVRTDLQLRVLDERYSENGQLAIEAWLRADVQVRDVDAFSAVVGIIP